MRCYAGRWKFMPPYCLQWFSMWLLVVKIRQKNYNRVWGWSSSYDICAMVTSWYVWYGHPSQKSKKNVNLDRWMTIPQELAQKKVPVDSVDPSLAPLNPPFPPGRPRFSHGHWIPFHPTSNHPIPDA
jgi:hypothetical protein